MSLTCAIMQPTYLPWAGYLGLMAAVDRFVLLDDVQYERKSWQCRNRILVDGEVRTIEVPVIKQPLTERIENIVIDNSKPWREGHLHALADAYGQAPFGEDVLRTVSASLDKQFERLCNLNADLIGSVAAALGVDTPVILASQLQCGGRRSGHVAEICKAMGADRYLSPPGAKDYLEQDNFVETSGIELSYFEFDALPYPQVGGGQFASHLSIVDVIANGGFEFAKSYVSRDA